MKKVILFDLDGTLIDSTDAIIETFYYSFKKKNFNFLGSYEDIKKEIGYPLDVMYEKFGVAKSDVWDFVDIYKQRYKNIAIEQTTLLPNAKASIDLAKKYARLGIVTTKTAQYSIPILKHLGIWEQFECIVGRQEVVNPKPHPEPLFKALELMNIKQNDYDIYMIGDTKLDLIAANEAKIKGIGVLSGYGTKDELSKYTNMIEADVLDAVKRIVL